MRELLTHALHSAKVINLPSHNAKSFKCNCRTEKGEKWLTYLICYRSGFFSSPLSMFVRPSSCVLAFSLPSGSPGAGACWRWGSGRISCCHVTATVCRFGRKDPATVLLLLIVAHGVVASFTAATGDHDGERKLLWWVGHSAGDAGYSVEAEVAEACSAVMLIFGVTVAALLLRK
jgi:hypothetical protein